MQDMYEAGINLSSALDYYYLTITDKPEHKLPEMKTKPVHLITFINHLGSPGQVAFLEDNSVIYLDEQSKTVSRVGITHGLVANYGLPNKEDVTCLAVQGKYFYIGGNKHVMKVPMLHNTEPSEYIRLPEEQEELRQLLVLADGTLWLQGKHSMHSYHPKTKKVEEVIHIVRDGCTFVSATKDETTICFTQPVKGMIHGVKLDGKIQKFKNNLSQTKATLVMEMCY